MHTSRSDKRAFGVATKRVASPALPCGLAGDSILSISLRLNLIASSRTRCSGARRIGWCMAFSLRLILIKCSPNSCQSPSPLLQFHQQGPLLPHCQHRPVRNLAQCAFASQAPACFRVNPAGAVARAGRVLHRRPSCLHRPCFRKHAKEPSQGLAPRPRSP